MAMKRSARSYSFTRTLVCLALTLAPLSGAESQPVTVEGKNNPAVDVQAVQKAVNQGGTIILKGRFDFGDKGSVTITKDVNVLGEMDEREVPRTTVRGGYYTFHSPPSARTPPPPGPKVTIKNIHFDGALWAPIRLAYASSVTIAGNRITSVRSHPALNRPQGGVQQSILVGTARGDFLSGGAPYQPGAVMRTVTITDNDIDLSTEAPTKTMAQGIFVMLTTGINARIARNTITNCARNSIEILDNYLSNEGGFIAIQDNKIVTATEGFARPSPATPNGIVVGYLRDRSAAGDPKRFIRHLILHNSIRARGKTSNGISVLTDGALVRNNHVVIEGPEARAINVAGSNNYIGQNKIAGSGALGLQLAPRAPSGASGNELDGNDFEQFKAAVADVLLQKGANDNTVMGTSGSVSDLGTGNEIRGLKPVTK
jgi:hypothetical protein